MPGPGETTDVNSLIAELNQETENNNTEVKPLLDKSTETTQPGTFNEPKEIPDPAKQPVEDISPTKAKSMAERWVRTFSSGAKMFFSFVYRKTILKPGDEKAMADFVRQHKGQSEREMQEAITSDSPLYDVSNRFEKYMKAVEAIPLDQGEIDSIAEPLQELIIKYKSLQLSPEWMLVISVGLVMLPRVAPMLPDMSKIFAPKQ